MCVRACVCVLGVRVFVGEGPGRLEGVELKCMYKPV